MISVRKAGERGFADHGWLRSWHSFSFAGYHDQRHMGFGPLRVINDDTVAPGKGFGMHGHQDMEILTYVLSGALEHQDSLGTGSVIRYGDVQKMSAGTGVHHSEFNHSTHEPVHFLQVWIIPATRGAAPAYEQKHFGESDKRGRLCLVASPDGREGSVHLLEAAEIYATILGEGERVEHVLAPGRLCYVHVATGQARVRGQALAAGDALLLQDEPGPVAIEGGLGEVLLFDLPP
jgi:redox-sensitive bicupin YhaK (pirin superfamily)